MRVCTQYGSLSSHVVLDSLPYGVIAERICCLCVCPKVGVGEATYERLRGDLEKRQQQVGRWVGR